jgi:hypothetical protein
VAAALLPPSAKTTLGAEMLLLLLLSNLRNCRRRRFLSTDWPPSVTLLSTVVIDGIAELGNKCVSFFFVFLFLPFFSFYFFFPYLFPPDATGAGSVILRCSWAGVLSEFPAVCKL